MIHPKKMGRACLLLSAMIFFFIAIFLAGAAIGNLIFARVSETKSSSLLSDKAKDAAPEASTLPKAPSTDASTAEKAAFAQSIRQTGVETTSIEIQSQCTLLPPVIRLAQGTSFTLANRDTVRRHIVIDTNELALDPKEEKTLTAKFTNGSGIYGIACERNTIGFIEILSNTKE